MLFPVNFVEFQGPYCIRIFFPLWFLKTALQKEREFPINRKQKKSHVLKLEDFEGSDSPGMSSFFFKSPFAT